MPAKDYKLAVSPLTGTVWIAKSYKRKPNVMTNDRVRVDSSEFINCMLEWTKNQLKEGDNVLNITEGKKVIAEIRLIEKEPDPDQLNLFPDG